MEATKTRVRVIGSGAASTSAARVDYRTVTKRERSQAALKYASLGGDWYQGITREEFYAAIAEAYDDGRDSVLDDVRRIVKEADDD